MDFLYINDMICTYLTIPVYTDKLCIHMTVSMFSIITIAVRIISLMHIQNTIKPKTLK